VRSKTPSSELPSLAVSLLAAVLAITCSAGTLGPARPVAAVSASGAQAPTAAAPPSSAPAPVASAEPPSADAGVAKPTGLALSRFAAALGALARRERTTHVRIAWLGDSHTAADYLTHAVRRPLQERFGNGGPGFVQLGVEPYRHALLKVGREGKWRREPSSPAGSMKQLDGIFGLGGQRAVPESADARASVELLGKASQGRTRFSLMYRAAAADRLLMTIRGTTQRETAGPKSGRSVGALRHHDIEADAPATLDLGVSAGAAEVFGVLIESTTPGVVLDTLGINGARAATPLAWNDAEWRAALADRDPALVVVAYGTNEAASTLEGTRYQKSLEELVARIRGAAPGADCLLVGPPDMATPSGESAPRAIEFDQIAKATAARVGCAHFSALSAMGGEGSFARWAKEKPPLAARDGVHLGPSGYERLGAALAEQLLATASPAP